MDLSSRLDSKSLEISEIVGVLERESSLLESTLYFTSTLDHVPTTEPGAPGYVDERMSLLYNGLVPYVGGKDYRFLGKVVSVFQRIFATTDLSESMFWFKQISYITDRFSKSFPNAHPPKAHKHTIANDGIKILLKKQDHPEFTEKLEVRFLNDLFGLSLEIYKHLLGIVGKDLGALLITIAFQPIDDRGQPTVARKAPQTPVSKQSTLIRKASAPRNQPTITKASKDQINPTTTTTTNKSSVQPATTTTTTTTTGTMSVTYSISEITHILSDLLSTMDKFGMYHSVVLQYFRQLYFHLDVVLFNELLQNASTHCVEERGFYLKFVTSELETWASLALAKYVKSTCTKQPNLGKLIHSSEAANVMTLDKSIFTDMQMVKEFFPNLTLVQLFRLLSKFRPSNLVPTQVLREIESKADVKTGHWTLSEVMLPYLEKDV